MRGILETEAAGLAAARRSAEDLKTIKQALDRMSGEERWQDGSIEADLIFHREIARATANDYIYTFVCFICEEIRQSIQIARYTNPLPELVEVNVAEHVRVYEALEAGDVEAARQTMRAHIWNAGMRIDAAPGNTADISMTKQDERDEK